jgi:hypothetical protein
MNAKFFTDKGKNSIHVITDKETIPHGFIPVFPYLLNRSTGKRVLVHAEDDGEGSYFYWADEHHINYGFLRHGEPFGYRLKWLTEFDIEEENRIETLIEKNRLETTEA